MKRIQKIKQSINNHREGIIASVVIVGIIALAVAVDITNAKQAVKDKETLDKYIIDQNRQGKTVVQLANGTYIGVTI